MLGGLGKDGVAIGGRGRDTGTVRGFDASVTGGGAGVAGLLSALADKALAAAAGADVTAGTGAPTVTLDELGAGAAFEDDGTVVETAALAVDGFTCGAAAVTSAGADAGVDAGAATLCIVEGTETGPLVDTAAGLPVELGTGAAGRVGVVVAAGVLATAVVGAVCVDAAGLWATVVELVGAVTGDGRNICVLFAAVGGRASGTLG